MKFICLKKSSIYSAESSIFLVMMYNYLVCNMVKSNKESELILQWDMKAVFFSVR